MITNTFINTAIIPSYHHTIIPSYHHTIIPSYYHYLQITSTPSNHNQSLNFQSNEHTLSLLQQSNQLCLQSMKYLFTPVLILLTLLVISSSSITSTSAFYEQQTGSRLSYQSYAGYENIDQYYPNGTAAIYYSLWQGFNLPWADKTVPLIIWLQGGPGAPSQFGCFNEVGPILIDGKKGNLKATENPWGWNFFGHLMCVDQPVGVGFSYNNNTKKVDNSKDAANHFANFLVNFYKNNPAFGLAGNPVYLAGQSYAGHYIPAIADKLTSDKSLNITLGGLLIGDGYVDPINQINNYDSFLNSVGAVSNQWRDTTTFMQNQAVTRIMDGDLKDSSGYINFIIADDEVANKYYSGMNVLNYKQYDAGNINQDYSIYLQNNKKILGVPDWMNYVDDNQVMYNDFAEDLSTSFKPQLQRLLSLGVKTLIYNGQNDFIVNTAGVLTYLNTLEWPSAQRWKAQPKTIWKQYGNQNLGWYKAYRNLIFCQVRNAGHLLPADQPRAAYIMLDKYFLNQW